MELADYLRLKQNRKRPAQNESKIQVAVVNYIKVKYPGVLFTIAPSGIKLPGYIARLLKAMGYRPGTPDIMIFEPRGGYYGLFLELKTDEGRLSVFQKDFLRLLVDKGYEAVECKGYDEAINTLEEYLNFGKVKKNG